MSEYEDFEELEDFEEEDFEDDEFEDRLGTVEEMLASQAELDEINRELADFQAAHGVSLDPHPTQAIGTLMDLHGLDAEDAYALVADASFEDDFRDTLERVERAEGRSLLDAEVDKLWQTAYEEGDPGLIAMDAVLDLDKPEDRADYFAGRLNPEPDTPEAVALTDDADAEDRAAYMDARIAGAEPDTEGDFDD